MELAKAKIRSRRTSLVGSRKREGTERQGRRSAILGFGSDITLEEIDPQFTPPASPLQSVVHQTEELLSTVKMARNGQPRALR